MQGIRVPRFLRALVAGLALLAGLQVSALATASTVPPLALGMQDSYLLGGSYAFLEDPTATLALDAVLSDVAQQRFRPLASDTSSANFGITRSAIWLRLRLLPTPQAAPVWLLEFAHPLMNHVDVYQSNSAGGFDEQAGGNALPYSARAVPHRNHVFALHVTPGRGSVVYVRLQSRGTVVVNSSLWRPEAFAVRDQIVYSNLSLYFGLLMGLCLYNLLLFFSVKDRVYLVYAGFVATMALYQGALTGLGAQFVWPESAWWNAHAAHVGVTSCSALSVLFTRDFLSSKFNMPRVDRLMQVLALVWIALLVVPLALELETPVRLTSLVAAISISTLLVAGSLGVLRGLREAKLFLLAWAALFVGASVLALLVNGIMASRPLAVYSLLIGSGLEMVLLSFALADRINSEREKGRQAQAASMAKHAMVEALSLSQERYRAVIEQVGEGMLVSQAGRTVFANARALEILGVSQQVVLDKGLAPFIHPDDQAQWAQRQHMRQTGQATAPRFEVRLARPDGLTQWLEVGDATIPWDGGQATLTFFQDHTERKKAETETHAAMQRQQDLNDLRSRFVAMTSHEFRTPLAIILSSHDLLKDYGEKMPPADKHMVMQSIASGVRRMELMLDRVLLLGRAEARMLEFNPQLGDLPQLCRVLELEAAALLAESPCTLVCEISDGVGSFYFDEQLLRHIIGNLLSNAIKYSPHGGQVRFAVYPVGSQMVFEVSDQGIGIPADALDNLFESFHRARNVGDIQGTGLGLAIVKNSVDLHGGTITVHSEIGRGTRFTVTMGGA